MDAEHISDEASDRLVGQRAVFKYPNQPKVNARERVIKAEPGKGDFFIKKGRAKGICMPARIVVQGAEGLLKRMSSRLRIQKQREHLVSGVGESGVRLLTGSIPHDVQPGDLIVREPEGLIAPIRGFVRLKGLPQICAERGGAYRRSC